MSIALLMCHRSTVEADTAVCLFDLARHMGSRVSLVAEETCYLDMCRERLIRTALTDPNVTHVAFVDSDMTFPPDTLERLVAHGRPVVAVNARNRHAPSRFIALKRSEGFVSSVGRTGLDEVQMVGFGVIVVERTVFAQIAEPWFRYSNGYEGEDVVFCVRCTEAGIPVLMDHDLSQSIGHIGKVTHRV